jgi:hypothetical protein
MQIFSDCCLAPLFPVEIAVCSKCHEICDPVTIGTDSNGNDIKVKV